MKDGDISLTECFAQKQYVYPRRIYEGMELFVDTNTLATESTWIQKEFGIDIPKIIELFCPNDNTYISAVTPEVEEILIKLWELFDIAPPFSSLSMFWLYFHYYKILTISPHRKPAHFLLKHR